MKSIYCWALLGLLGCTPQLHEESTSRIRLSSELEGEPASRGVSVNESLLSGVQLLRQDGSSAPTDFSGATVWSGLRSADGRITFSGEDPVYSTEGLHSYFVAYHPAGTAQTGGAKWTIDGKSDVLLSPIFDAGTLEEPVTGPLVFKHRLAQLEVVCVADQNSLVGQEEIQAVWGQITKIELLDTPTELQYSYASNTVSNGTTLGALPLVGKDYDTDFAATAIEKNADRVVTAAGMFVPGTTTDPIKLKVYTEKEPAGKEVSVQLQEGTTKKAFAIGKRHTVTLQFRGAGKDIELLSTAIDAWKTGYGADPEVSANVVSVGGVLWATGNLVADGKGGCKIGAPTDGGLYFQFGSLIGYKGGNQANGGTGVGLPQAPLTTNDTFWNGSGYSWESDAMVWPKELVGTKTAWTNSVGDNIATLSDYYFNYSEAPWSTPEQNIRDFAVSISGDKGSGTLATGRYAKQGVGDPCTYYLGSSWRLPTSAEIVTLCNNQKPGYGVNVAWSSCGASWTTAPVNGGNFASNQLFFPASGYRYNSNSSFYNITTYGYCWSSSVYNATLGLDLNFRSSWVYPQSTNTRSNAFPVRCVMDAPTVPTPPTPEQYVTVGRLRWATGNLVAVGAHNAKIGAPTDGGLYFQFGSLIGYKGGDQANGGTGVGMPKAPLTTNETYWNGSGYSWESDAKVWPSELVGTKTAWANTTGENTSTLSDYYFNYSAAPWQTDGRDIREFTVPISGDKRSGTLGTGRYAAQGVGDPCTYYLGGTWRLPTTEEWASITGKTGNSWIAWNTVGLTGIWATASQMFGNVSGPGAWFGADLSSGSGTPSPLTNPFFPASGYRNNLDGSFGYVTVYGYCWSSSVYDAMLGYRLAVHESSGVMPQARSNRASGFPVRCVQDIPTEPIPPTADQYVTINGLKWAKGNLVADGAHNAKIGAPGDGGLYFQFGSLIGYKGGDQSKGGTGVGMPQAPLTTNGTYWDGSGYSWESDAKVWPSEMVGTKSLWGSAAGSNISTLSDYYFNYSVAPWQTQGQNIRDFAVSISGDKGSGTLATGRYAKQGVGDPCTYYLGGTWRLPTTAEIVALCNNQKPGYGTNVAWSDAGGSWTTTPVNGGNFVSNQLFFFASGYRSGSNGSFYNVTTGGHYWSSSVYSAMSGLGLTFNSSWAYPQANSSRSNGFPVRCVSE